MKLLNSEIKNPEKQKIELNEKGFFIELEDGEIYNSRIDINPILDKAIKNGMLRKDKETAEKTLKQIRLFTRLLALRDQECKDSRGYEFIYGEDNYHIYKNNDGVYTYGDYQYTKVFTVVFKTVKDAQKICDILNSGRFTL